MTIFELVFFQISKMIRHIPNFITTLNLFCGCIAVVMAFDGQLVLASVFVGLGSLFDFFDGFAARLLKVKSPIGKELDSLADVITFGLVPGIIIYLLMLQDISAPYISMGNISVLPLLGFAIPIFSALRLAKFNVDHRQESIFLGLPTPASALIIMSFPLILWQQSTPIGMDISLFHQLITNFYFLVALTVFISWLMVSEVKLFSLKFNNFSWKENKLRYTLLAVGIVFIFSLHFVAIPFIILFYVLMSLIFFRTVSS